MLETVSLYSKSFGKGPAVVILHGLFGASDNWQTLAKKLAEDYTVYLVDQRNHGRSPHHEVMHYRALAADLNQFLIDNKIENPVLIGHSMGGKTVMQFIQTFDYPIAGFISVDMGIKAYQGDHKPLFQAMLDLPIEQVKSRQEATDILSKSIDNKGVLLFLLKNIQRDKDGFKWKINLPVLWSSYPSLMAALSPKQSETKGLFLHGEASNYILPADMESIQSVFPNTTFQAVKKAGHWVHAENPTATLSAFRTFLESCFFENA